ncbi:hypothetical protein Ae168Ps1_4601c [Pseudonocardia sp. Ae168_Ps1]|nr:hypothetical protein Ae150APs1_4573c [Pseudonocardia sp. Ae150A_Ps1]OLL82195.1 hypothetical protein Ae168Ps1_4601c [Pseudonocardia sp. Ae168_Ps1]OLL83690.1 hypothetical protein Ae263Ps1_0745 [Pseudonocardia sp. Ae263_Ps1]OLL90269.1 hypothetical protein Ae356Ps1_0166c [Pseudonocardia sp. Ae356_Ps1]
MTSSLILANTGNRAVHRAHPSTPRRPVPRELVDLSLITAAPHRRRPAAQPSEPGSRRARR